jgi:hypothetical protein
MPILAYTEVLLEANADRLEEAFEMGNYINSTEVFRLLVLVPHRDTVKLLRDYSRRLFGAGFSGAFSFPAAAPLALLSRPGPGEELRGAARTLRQAALAGGREGKIQAGAAAALPFPDIPGAGALSGLSLFGPALDLAVPDLSLPGLIYPFPALVLCTALVEKGDYPRIREPAPLMAACSFRAAAVANMVFRPLGSQGFSGGEWKIGRLSWLPRADTV